MLGVLGCGVQGRNNLEALKVLFPLRHRLRHRPGAPGRLRRVRVHAGPAGRERRAVASSRDRLRPRSRPGPILRQPHATIKAGWLDAGAFASLVDYDSDRDGPRWRKWTSSLQTMSRTSGITSMWATPKASRPSMPVWASRWREEARTLDGNRADHRLQSRPRAG